VKKRKLSEEQIVKLRSMHEAGLSYVKIEIATGVPSSTVEYNINPAYSQHKKEYDRVLRQIHGAVIRQRENNYNAAHRRERARYAAEWRKKNPDKGNVYHSVRRALKAGFIIGATVDQLAETKEIYRKAREDTRVRCYLCGQLIAKGHRQVDHIIPLSKGGQHRPSNLAVACDACNDSKKAKMPEEMGVLL